MLENLKTLRETNRVTQRQLAEAIGVSQQSVNKYENHNIEPDVQTLIRIADFFSTSVDYLIGRTSKPVFELSCSLSEEEQELIQKYRMLTSYQQECVRIVTNSYR